MIVILHSRSCHAIAEAVRGDLITAFNAHVEVRLSEAESAANWPSAAASWDDLLIVLFDGAPFPGEGTQFIEEYQAERTLDAVILPVAIDHKATKPPSPADGIKAMVFDSAVGGVSGRLVNRAGGMLGLKIQSRRTKLFISYRRADGSEIAHQLHLHLSSLGLRAFLDEAREFDDEPMILPGSPVQKEIDDALSTANIVLLIDTPKAPESIWVKHEVDTADGLILPILPICFRESGDTRPGTRFRQLLPLQRWMVFPLPRAGSAPLTTGQLDTIVGAAESYMCDVFQRKCRVPFIVRKEFVSRGFDWAVRDQKLLMFQSTRTGGRLVTKVLNHCSIFDEIYEPAIKRFHAYLQAAGYVNHSLFIYDGELLSEAQMTDLSQNIPEPVLVLHHQELAALIDSNFTKLGKA